MKHSLVVRLDSLGDMLICGPAIRAVAANSDQVTVLAGPRGAAAARLLPGVDEVEVWSCPWIASPAPAVEAADVNGLTRRLRRRRITDALILTSFHQSAMPTALLLRMAGVPRIAAVSEDYPGSLLTTRVPPPPDGPEPIRMLEIAEAAGFSLPPGDDGRLAVRHSLPAPDLGPERYVVLHPGASAPARRYPLQHWIALAAELSAAGRRVVVTGSADEVALTAAVASVPAEAPIVDLGGRLDLPQLAGVLAGADVLVAANTGPAHLAAAVGTPVVSLFAPVVPSTRWAPYGVPCVLLGDQAAPCRHTRAVDCPVDGHPCLSTVDAVTAAQAVQKLTTATVPAGRQP